MQKIPFIVIFLSLKLNRISKTNEFVSYTTHLQILRKTSSKILKEFLLKLGKETKQNFNPLGRLTLSNIDLIVKEELNSKDKIKFFSYCGDELIAYSYLTKFKKYSKRHNCILGIVISDNWQGKGFGKKICNYMIKYAWNRKYNKIWLTVFANNLLAINMYKSLGFEIEGVFMNDEFSSGKNRHVVSMAIFKNKKNYTGDRKKIWNKMT